MFELTTTAAASAAAIAEYTPVRELAGRFSDVPKVDLTDYHQYSILVEDFKGVIIFTAMFTHAFVAATATSKLNLDLRDDDFLIGFQDALQFPIVKKAAAGIRLKRTADGVQATVPLGQLTRIQRTPELLSRRLGGDLPALKAFMQGLRLIHPSLSEPGPIDFEIPSARRVRASAWTSAPCFHGASQSLPMNSSPYGGSVTTESTEQSNPLSWAPPKR
jgi:hypothetical protein